MMNSQLFTKVGFCNTTCLAGIVIPLSCLFALGGPRWATLLGEFAAFIIPMIGGITIVILLEIYAYLLSGFFGRGMSCFYDGCKTGATLYATNTAFLCFAAFHKKHLTTHFTLYRSFCRIACERTKTSNMFSGLVRLKGLLAYLTNDCYLLFKFLLSPTLAGAKHLSAFFASKNRKHFAADTASPCRARVFDMFFPAFAGAKSFIRLVGFWLKGLLTIFTRLCDTWLCHTFVVAGRRTKPTRSIAYGDDFTLFAS